MGSQVSCERRPHLLSDRARPPRRGTRRSRFPSTPKIPRRGRSTWATPTDARADWHEPACRHKLLNYMDGIRSSSSPQRSASFLLALLRRKGTGRKKALAVAMQSRWSSRNSTDAPSSEDIHRAEREIEAWKVAGIQTLAFFDDEYPPLLRTVSDPPPLLWVQGDVQALHERAVAVVGTREPSKFGVRVAEKVTASALSGGWTVISGLAQGVDTVAHRTAVHGKGRTVAVMAGGLDTIYPTANKDLARQIVETKGALLAESPPGTRPRAASFVDRDRLQSGLARAVFICQTGDSGGTLHTARFAVQQGRPIFCPVPPSSEEKNRGLEVLLSVPGRHLPSLFREWTNVRWSRGQLGDSPVALGFELSSVREIMKWLLDTEHRVSEDEDNSDLKSPAQRELLELLG